MECVKWYTCVRFDQMVASNVDKDNVERVVLCKVRTESVLVFPRESLQDFVTE